MGGGGFISAIIPSSVDKNLFYARTDVGGAYRWDESTGNWKSMMDWVDVSERGLLGIEALAVDPQKTGTVYMVAGTSYWNNGRTAFLKSTNKGDSWTVTYIDAFGAHGNGMGRGNGEALAVDPNNSNILFYGSRNKGLFKSTNNGSSWAKVAGFTQAAGSDTTWNGSGFSFVTFAPGSSTVLYAGFLREGKNVFRSKDGGSTWEALSIPTALKTTAGGAVVRLMPQRIAIPQDGSALVVTFSDGAGPHTMAWDEGWGPIFDGFGRGAVLKYNTATSTWTDISPEDYIDNGETGPSKFDSLNVADETYEYIAPYGGVAMNPQNPLEMVATTMGYRSPQYWYSQDDKGKDKWSDQWGANIFHTKDGGKTWVGTFQAFWTEGGFFPTAKQMDANGVDWMYNGSIHWSGSVAIDPFNPKRVWVSSGNGIFRTDDITNYTITPAVNSWDQDQIETRQVWKFMAHGIEETVPEEVVSIPGGPLISVIADYDGFRHDDIRQFPAFRHQTEVGGSAVSLGSTRGLAFAPLSGTLVKVSDARSVNPDGYNDVPISPLQFSSDSGKTWKAATYESISENYKKGSVAISADGAITLWMPGEGTSVMQRYAESNWGTVSGVDGAYPVGDPKDANVFYAYSKTSGFVYRSSDKGLTFTQVGSAGVSEFKKMRVAPGRTGDLWVPIFDAAGKGALKRSQDGGTSFTAVAGVSNCEAVGFGKAKTAGAFPSVFIYGTVGKVTGLFQSDDEGATWIRVNDDNHEYGGLANGEFVMGDMNTYGVVYMSTAGRGIAVRVPADWDMYTSTQGNVTSTQPIVLGASLAGIYHNALHLTVAAQEPLHVQIYGLNGKLLYNKRFESSVQLPMRQLMSAKGVAVLHVRSENRILLNKTISRVQ